MKKNTIVDKLQSYAKATLVLCWICFGVCILLSFALGFAAFVVYIILFAGILVSAYISYYVLHCFAAILKTVSNIEQLMIAQNSFPPIPHDTYTQASIASEQEEKLPEL